MSLKSILYEQLKRYGELSLNEVERICKENCYKLSNAERRLRPSESPWIAQVRNDDGAIIAYRWLQPKVQERIELPIQHSLIKLNIKD